MTELKKVLSYRVVLLITINAIMGTGIFFLPALGAGKAGPASVISWAIMGAISIYIAMCFAELTSMYPKAGGVYEFCKQAYGRFTSFMIGWTTMLAGNITIAMLVVGAVQYLLPYDMPHISIPVSLMFVFIFNYIAYRGMKTSAVMLIAFSFITLGTLFGLIIPGLFHFNTENVIPFFVFPLSAILVTIFFIAETFFGWETATFLAEETKDGKRVMPKALIISTIIIAIISIVFVITTIGTIHWSEISKSAAPLADLSGVYYGSKAAAVFTILVYLSIIGSVAGWIVSAPRLLLGMARDKLFLSQLASIHPKYQTPYKAIIFQTILTSIIVIAGSGSYQTLLMLLVPIVLLLYSSVILSLVFLRYKKPDVKRYYTVPFGKIGPLIVIAGLLGLIVYWVMETTGAFALLRFGGALILAGIPLYFLLEMYYSPKDVRRVNNMLAFIEFFLENLYLPKRIRKKIINLMGEIKGKTILEFGCGVGTLTQHIAVAVGRMGKIFATDISERHLDYAKKRMKKRGYKHVRIMHDPQHMDRVHPDVTKVDMIVSVGTLSYINKVGKVLKEMNKKLKKGSKVVFLDFDKFFYVIPNKEWICDDKKIKEVFRRAGFEVDIIRKQGLFWKYVYIVGEKVKRVK